MPSSNLLNQFRGSSIHSSEVFRQFFIFDLGRFTEMANEKEKSDSVKKLQKIDPLNVNTHKQPSNIDAGFAARALVLEYNRKVSHKVPNVLKFQKGALALILNLSLHFIE